MSGTSSTTSHLRPHVPVLSLRRVRAGELTGAEAEEIHAHVSGCPLCRAKQGELAAEEEALHQDVSLERFAAGTERAARQAKPKPRPQSTVLMALAAGLVLVIATPLVFKELRSGELGGGTNRIKGGADVTLQIAGSNGAQRTGIAAGIEPLIAGDRVRIGLATGGLGYVTAISIDERGEVTPLYPERGQSLAVPNEAGVHYLPDSLEFTGEGKERVVVILSATPLEVEAVLGAARGAYEKAGRRLEAISPLELPGEQFHRTLLKP